MTTPSAKLGLVLPYQPDPFVTDDVRGNYEKIDAAPGAYICTSNTRPSWTMAQAGRKIIETNTRLEWLWTGALPWVRLAGQGLLKRSDGSFAIGETTTAYSTTKKTYNKVISVTSVVVPAGNRPIRVDVNYLGLSNTAGSFLLAIYRSNTDNAGPFMSHWNSGTAGTDDYEGGGAMFTIERGGLAAGTYDFSFQAKCGSAGGTSKIGADGYQPIGIYITEM